MAKARVSGFRGLGFCFLGGWGLMVECLGSGDLRL